MDKKTFDRIWDQTRQKYGIYLRVPESIPEDRYHDHPVEGMRTPAELVVHTSRGIVRDIARGVAKGAITTEGPPENEFASSLTTKADVISFARECWEDADSAASTIGDEELSASVPTPWDMQFPGWVGFNILSDEFLHHRGQLYAYARACGGEPPFLWSFGDNDKEFGPAAD